MPTPNIKVLVAEVDGVELDLPQERLLHAQDAVFDPGDSVLTSTDANSAIKEATTKSEARSRFYVFADYGGSAGVDRYLSIFNGISTEEAPLLSPFKALDIIEIVARTASSTSTCTIGFWNIAPVTPVLLYTLTFSAVKQVTASGSPLFQVPIGAALAIKVDSGSINKPHVYFVGQGAL